jgi:hypothetical protein
MKRHVLLVLLLLALARPASAATILVYHYEDILTVTLTELDGGVFLDYELTDGLWTEVDWINFGTLDGTVWHTGPPAFHPGWQLARFGFFSAAQVSRDCRICEPDMEGPETGIPSVPCTKIISGTREDQVPEPSLLALFTLAGLSRRWRWAGRGPTSPSGSN